MAYEFQGQTLAKKQAQQKPSRRSSATPRAPRAPRERTARNRSLMQVLAGVFGLTFLLAGVAGFIPGITSNYDDLALFGIDSRAKLLGLFRVSVLHNIVHALFGIGLLAAARYSWSKLYLLGGAAAYAGVVAYGFVIDHESEANFLPINNADNLLHVGLTLGMIGAGVVGLAAAKRAAA